MPFQNGSKPVARNCFWNWYLDGDCTSNLIVQAVVFHDQYWSWMVFHDQHSSRHCLQVLSGLRCPEGPKPHTALWRVCYNDKNSLSVLKSPLLAAHWVSHIRDRLAYSGIRNITDKYKEGVCLSLSKGRFSEILLSSGILRAQGTVGKPGEVSQDHLG